MMEGASQEEAKAVANTVLARLGTQNADVDINDGQELSGDANTVDVTIEIPVADNALILDKAFVFFGLTKKWGNETIVSELSMRKERYEGFFNPDDI